MNKLILFIIAFASPILVNAATMGECRKILEAGLYEIESVPVSNLNPRPPRRKSKIISGFAAPRELLYQPLWAQELLDLMVKKASFQGIWPVESNEIQPASFRRYFPSFGRAASIPQPVEDLFATVILPDMGQYGILLLKKLNGALTTGERFRFVRVAMRLEKNVARADLDKDLLFNLHQDDGGPKDEYDMRIIVAPIGRGTMFSANGDVKGPSGTFRQGVPPVAIVPTGVPFFLPTVHRANLIEGTEAPWHEAPTLLEGDNRVALIYEYDLVEP